MEGAACDVPSVQKRSVQAMRTAALAWVLIVCLLLALGVGVAAWFFETPGLPPVWVALLVGFFLLSIALRFSE